MFSANDVKEKITNLRLRVIMLQNQFLVSLFDGIVQDPQLIIH